MVIAVDDDFFPYRICAHRFLKRTYSEQEAEEVREAITTFEEMLREHPFAMERRHRQDRARRTIQMFLQQEKEVQLVEKAHLFLGRGRRRSWGLQFRPGDCIFVLEMVRTLGMSGTLSPCMTKRLAHHLYLRLPLALPPGDQVPHRIAILPEWKLAPRP